MTASLPNPEVSIDTLSIVRLVSVFSPPVTTTADPRPVKSFAFLPSELSEKSKEASLRSTDVSASVPLTTRKPVLVASLSFRSSPSSETILTLLIFMLSLSATAVFAKLPLTSFPETRAPRIKLLLTPFSAQAGITEPVVETSSSAEI